MRVSARRLNRATLGRQLLLRREPLRVTEAMRHVVALQAQEPASPYLALWNRLEGFDPADLDAAFADQAIVRASLMRITLHAVHAADWPAFHAAMTPTLRAARLNDARFKRTGLSSADADALMSEVLAFAATPRTNAQGEAWLDERLGVTPKPGAWWAFRHVATLWHHPAGGPWSFGPRAAYVAARPVAGVWRPFDGGIEVTAFHPLPDEAWDGLETEARGLTAFLADRDPAVYRRYGRWWRALPGAQVRVIGG